MFIRTEATRNTIVRALNGVYPLSRPSKEELAVSFEENHMAWHTSPGNRQALAERVGMLAQARVVVTLPDRPEDDA